MPPSEAPTGWEEHYDRPEHLALDLRLIADNTDRSAGYVTMDGNILRQAAACFDKLPVPASFSDAQAALRKKG